MILNVQMTCKKTDPFLRMHEELFMCPFLEKMWRKTNKIII